MIRESMEPSGIPIGATNRGEIAMLAFGEMVGAFTVLRRLMNLEAEAEQHEDVVDKYRAVDILKKQFGISDKEAIALIERMKEA